MGGSCGSIGRVPGVTRSLRYTEIGTRGLYIPKIGIGAILISGNEEAPVLYFIYSGA